MAKPGDPDYEHVPGQTDIYDVLDDMGVPRELPPPPANDSTGDACWECGRFVREEGHKPDCPIAIRALVQQRLKGEAGDAGADTSK